VRDAHLCCGSAGTYSLLHPELAGRLRDDKIAALSANQPDEIVTANIGCQTYLQGATGNPVRHWIELVDDLLTAE
jgi:glycolate oxidase iron-sulfur subunit